MHPIREDLRATLDARRDLGPEYESALVESFVERLDASIAARVRAEVDAYGPRPKAKSKPGTPGAAMIPITLGSMGLAIPLSAIAGGYAEGAGIALVWIAIVVINIAAAIGIARSHR